MLLSDFLKGVIVFFLAVKRVHTADKCVRYVPITIDECVRPPVLPTGSPGQCTKLSNDTVCQKTFNITTIQDNPFKDLFVKGILNKALKFCCGDCVKTRLLHNYASIDEFGKNLKSRNVEMADFIYPIVSSSAKKYDKNFLPLNTLRSAELYTEKLGSKDTVKSLMTACLNLWPLILITLLMAFVAGFIEWLLDTWNNEDEFPRDFVRGVFQGFWWSFVSMTTVGYGDKSPRSVTARLFAVFWIVIGITICSMLTASLTNAITEASGPATPEISGKTVGILNAKIFDMVLVIQEEGIPKGYDSVEELKAGFIAGETDGFLLDSFTGIVSSSSLNDYRKTHVKYSGDPMSYGVLVTHDEDYEYLKALFDDYGNFLEACNSAKMGIAKAHDEEDTDIFSTSAGLFVPTVVTMIVLIVFISMFGVFYETRRRKKIKEEPQVIDEVERQKIDSSAVQELEKLLERLKEEKSVTYENTRVE